MKKNLISILILLFATPLYSQYWIEEDSTGLTFHSDYFHYLPRTGHKLLYKNDSLVVQINPQGSVEYRWVLPVYPQGIDSLKKDIYTKLRYPPEALQEKKEGIVDVFFKVNKSGEISSVKVGNLYAFGIEKEVKRVLNELPPFKPGTMDDKVDEFTLFLKINFKLIDGKPMTYEQFLKEDALAKSEIVYNYAVKFFNEEKYQKAIIFFSQVIDLNSKDHEAYYNRGMCKGKLADKEGACSDWKKAISMGCADYKNMLRVCK